MQTGGGAETHRSARRPSNIPPLLSSGARGPAGGQVALARACCPAGAGGMRWRRSGGSRRPRRQRDCRRGFAFFSAPARVRRSTGAGAPRGAAAAPCRDRARRSRRTAGSSRGPRADGHATIASGARSCGARCSFASSVMAYTLRRGVSRTPGRTTCAPGGLGARPRSRSGSRTKGSLSRPPGLARPRRGARGFPAPPGSRPPDGCVTVASSPRPRRPRRSRPRSTCCPGAIGSRSRSMATTTSRISTRTGVTAVCQALAHRMERRP